MFSGAADNLALPGEPDLGASSNVVARLTHSVPDNVNHKIYFDNWFTSVPLQVHLAKRGILSLGTVRLNRLFSCTMPNEKELKKRGRGSYVEKVATEDSIELSAVVWSDNKTVALLPNILDVNQSSRQSGILGLRKFTEWLPAQNLCKCITSIWEE